MVIPGVQKQESRDDYVRRCEEQGIDEHRAQLNWNLDRLWWQALKAKDADALRVVLVDVIELQRQMLEL